MTVPVRVASVVAMADHVQVITTTDSEDSASALARAIVEAQLAACVQVTAVRSFYRWEGAAQDDPEWQLQVKTSAARLDDLVGYISRHHAYDVPEIIVTPIVAGNPEYLRWVDEQTQPPR